MSQPDWLGDRHVVHKPHPFTASYDDMTCRFCALFKESVIHTKKQPPQLEKSYWNADASDYS